MDTKKWVGDYAPREYDPAEVSNLVLEVYDHATHNGHMLKDWETHPVYASVRLFRCSGCLAVYRLPMPGRSVAVWDAPSLVVPPGICPSSFAGIMEHAWGPEGGLMFWWGRDSQETANDDVTIHLADLSHGPIRVLRTSPIVVASKGVLAQTMPSLWRCDTCLRLVAKLSYPRPGWYELWVSHQTCLGHASKIRGGK